MQQHIPRIQPDVRLHDGDARFRFPVQNTRGHGGRAAVFGEQGSVDIINARGKRVQNAFGEQLAVRAGHHKMGAQAFKFTDMFADLGKIQYGNAAQARENFERRGRDDRLSPHGLVRLGDDCRHLVTFL